MSEITLQSVVDELKLFNQSQSDSILMDNLRDERDFKIGDAAEKQGVKLQGRIDFSNVLLEKLNRGFGSFIGFMKQSDMQNAEDRRELLESLRGGIKTENHTNINNSEDNTNEKGVLSKFNSLLISLVGGTTVGGSILKFGGNIKKSMISIFNFFKNFKGESKKIFTKLSSFLGKTKGFIKILGRFTGVLTLVYTAFSAISGAIDGYMSNGLEGMLRGGLIEGVNALVGWLFDIGKFLGKMILKLTGADQSTLDAIDSFSFKDIITKVYDTIATFLKNRIASDMESLSLLLEGDFMGFIENRIQSFKDSISAIFDKLTSVKEFFFGPKKADSYNDKVAKEENLNRVQKTIFHNSYEKSRGEGLSSIDARKKALSLAKNNGRVVESNKPNRAARLNELEGLNSKKTQSNTNIAVGGNSTNVDNKSQTIVMSSGTPSDGFGFNYLSY